MGFQVNTSDKGGFTIPAGSLNSSLYNQSAVWSGMFSPAPSGSGQETRTFNGEFTGTGGYQPGYMNGGGSWVPTGGLTYYSTVEVYDEVDQKYAINGGTQAAIALNQWVTIASTTSPSGATLTSIDFTRISDASTTHGPKGIKIDGKILVDSGVSVTNVPSIASQVMASPESGFSIVKYTGNGSANATTGHGLNEKPSIIIYKDTDTSTAWRVIPAFINDGHYLALNNTNEIVTGSTSYFGTSTNSVIGITGSNSGINNASGKEIIAYCFAPVAGYSAMGSYVGTGSSPNFVYLGFRPKLIIIKNTNGGNNWLIQDSERSTYNLVDDTLHPNTNDDEDTSASNYGVDFLSNGFALRTTGGYTTNSNNASEGHTYIYMAFAENPFQANGGLAR